MSTIFDNQGKPFKPLGQDDEWLRQKLKEHMPKDDSRDYLNVWTTPSETPDPIAELPED
ncbi:hypothetical protein D9M68_17680 [compost metagenome]